MNTQRLGPIILLIMSITAIHISVPMEKLPSHNYIRELYLIPIILAGLWWGTKGGMAVAIICSLLYLPHFLFKAPPDFHTRNMVEISLFNLIGYLVGRYRDTTRRDCIAAKNSTYPPSKVGKRVLFCVDNTPIGIQAAGWFAKYFTNIPENEVTLFWVSERKNERFPESSQKAVAPEEEAQNQSIDNLSQVKKILLKEGMAEDKIQFKTSDCDRESSVSEKILEELKSARYDTVFVAKHDVTRVQEFLFGDTTINLVRKSPVPVFVARGQPDKEVEE